MTRQVIEVPLELLDDGTNVRTLSQRQLRGYVHSADVGLRESIRALGVLQPITVVRTGKRYEVLYGHRRTAAARAAGLATIPAVLEADPDEKPIRQLVENQHRLPVNPIDIARTLRAYMDEHPEDTRASAQVVTRHGPLDEKVVENPVHKGKDAPDHRGCLVQSKIGGDPMTVRRAYGAPPATYPQDRRESSPIRGQSDGPSAADEHAHRVQREHELSRALEAARLLSERLELAHLLGHIPAVRRIRDDLADRLGDLVINDDIQPTQEQLP